MKTSPFQRKISVLLVFCMALTLALGCTGCGGIGGTGPGASAATMFLRKTEGTVAVSDAEGADVAPAENLGLYSGYSVGTGAESFAWIDLDKVKLAKLDESSAAAITKDGKSLFINITSGSLFFNVTEPLEEDETMEISTSSMLVGIRGTCGWAEVPESGTMRVYILEGKVACTAGQNTAMVNAGEMAEMTAGGTIEVSAFTAWDVPAFVTAEIEADEALSEAVLDASGIDTAGDLQSIYPDVFADTSRGEIIFADEFDFEADGSPELLVLYKYDERTENNNTYPGGYQFFVYRKETERSQFLCNASLDVPGDSVSGKMILAKSGDRLYICIYREYDSADGSQGNSYGYWGSTASNDGGNSYWGRVDYVWRHRLNNPSYTYKRGGVKENGLRTGAYEDSDIGEYEAVIAQIEQFTEVRVLVEG